MRLPTLLIPGVLGLSIAAAACLLASRGSTQLQSMADADADGPGNFNLDAIAADVQHYDQLGPHRTGSGGDLATTDWLEARFRELGYRVRRHPFSITTSIPRRTYLQLRNDEVDAFPLFPVTATPPQGVSGTLKLWRPNQAPPGVNALVVVDSQQSDHQGTLANSTFYQRLNTAAASGASAVIVLTRAGCGTFQALNADLRLPAWPVPVVLVGERDADRLLRAMSTAEPVTLVSQARRETVTAYNLIADIGPPEAQPIVVSTPQSGWFHAAGERGTGIAVFLSLARWAAAQPGNRFIFLANSGHERGNAGARKVLGADLPAPGDITLWLHLGANVGTLKVPPDEGVVSTRYAMASWFLVPKLWSLLRGHPGRLSLPIPLELGLARGELADYHDRGYRPLVGIFGSSPYHHCANDRFGNASPEASRQVALSMAALLSAFTASSRPD